MARKKNLLLIPIGTQYTPSSRVRVYQLAPNFVHHGWKVKIIAPARTSQSLLGWRLGLLSRFTSLLRKARWADLIFLQKWVFPIPLFKLLTTVNPNVVFDFDDAIYIGQNNAVSASYLAALNYTLTHSSIIIAGNNILADYATKYNDKVHVVPSPVDTRQFFPIPKQEPLHITTIGWVGSKANQSSLTLMQPVFQKLIQEHRESICLRIVSDGSSFLPDSWPVEYRKWKLMDEPKNFEGIDIGVMPLEDSEWSRGKCSYKALQYMALGIPAVVSPVGMNREIFINKESGFLAETQEEWLEALSFLFLNPDIRQIVGQKGREIVEQKYSLEIVGKELAGIMNAAS